MVTKPLSRPAEQSAFSGNRCFSDFLSRGPETLLEFSSSGQWESVRCRLSLPVPADGGSPSYGELVSIWAAASNPAGGETACLVAELELILLLADFLTVALACECFFYTLLLTRLQIKRMTLDFLDNVFGLHLALEAPQGILKGFAFLYSNLCQEKYTSKRSQRG